MMNRPLLKLANDILNAYGYQVPGASNAEQALSILGKTHIDLVISDVIMPVMDDYQLATRVQKKYPHVKIQMASGCTDDRHCITADNTLHQNMLYKPYTSKTLLVHVRDLPGSPTTHQQLIPLVRVPQREIIMQSALYW